MDPTGGRDSRYNLNYSLGMMAGESPDSIYGNPNLSLARPPSGNLLMGGGGSGGRGGGGLQGTNNNNNNSTSPGSLQCGLNRGMKRTNSDCYDDRVMTPGQTTLTGLETVNCGPMGDGLDDGYTSLQPAHNNHGQHHNNNNNHSPVLGGGQAGQQQQPQAQTGAGQPNKKSPPSNGKKTKGRVKIKMEYIDNKLRRYTTFSKRKTGIMKKAYELSTLTGTQVMLLVASETGHVYTFATRKLQPMITSEAGKALIQTCLNSPDPPSGAATGDQRMSATGFEETELSYNIGDEDSKDGRSPMSSGAESDDSSGPDSPSVVMPIRTANAATQQQQKMTRTSIMEPNGLQGLVVEKHHQQQQQHHVNGNSSNAVATTTGGVSIRMSNSSKQASSSQGNSSGSSSTSAINLAGFVGQLSRLDGIVSDIPSGLYPPSAFQHIPPEIVMQLVEMGQLKFHSNEDGQFIGVPERKGPGGGGAGSSSDAKDSPKGNGKGGSRIRNGRDGSPGDLRIKKESGE